MQTSPPSLYLVCLGGRIKTCNIEQHDLRWVIGCSIDDTFSQLRREWIGNQKGLHLDSYVKISYVDGFRILVKRNKINQLPEVEVPDSKSSNKFQLWFVHLGAYDLNNIYELHKSFLIVANTAQKAKIKAINAWNQKLVDKHKDDLYNLSTRVLIDDCYPLTYIGEWSIILLKDPHARSQELKPDWVGYKRIDIYNQQELNISY